MLLALAHNEIRQSVVLVVEDEILVRVGIADYLRDAGFAVIEAATAAEAVAVFASGTTIDLVFTDWQMPGAMDGVMLAHWIGQHHPSVPVLIASGYGTLSAAVPRNSFFRKPYSSDRVVARIRALLEPPGEG